MKISLALPFAFLLCAQLAWPGKQKIILRLREPLRAETVKIRIPELSNGKGETRDLETQLHLGGAAKSEAPKVQEKSLKLDMVLRPVGKNAVQVTLTLPEAGYVQLMILDFYGKNEGVLLDGPLTQGVYNLSPFMLKEGDHNGINFVTLKINDKVAMKKVMTKVR
jgi:hypothetical protein